MVFGIDETIERRWGAQISARGIYRDPVRSSKSHFVKTSGLRWIRLMWLTSIPWAQRVWALPILTALAPSERFYDQSVRSYKKLTDWARQMIFQLRRWIPKRPLVVVADSSYAALDLLHAAQSLPNPVTTITRLRLDAALYTPAPAYSGRGRPRKKGRRLPTLQLLLTDQQTSWAEVTVAWYDGRVRTLEIASDTAVWYHSGKPTVDLRWVLIRDPEESLDPMALCAPTRTMIPGRSSPGSFSAGNWYVKQQPTFSDAMAWTRQLLWHSSMPFSVSPSQADEDKIPRSWALRLVDTLCYAA